MLTSPPALLLAVAQPKAVLGIALAARGDRVALVEAGRTLVLADDVPGAARTRADLLLARHGRGQPNLPLPTCGGLQLWGDVFWGCGWRIQQHVWTSHHRLLDPLGIRRAWGDPAACRTVYEDRRVALGLQPQRRLVLALAGLGRTRHALASVAAAIGAADDLALIAYPSTRAPLAAQAARLRQLLADLHGVERVAIVTHSLGALVARMALAAPEVGRVPAAVGRSLVQRNRNAGRPASGGRQSRPARESGSRSEPFQLQRAGWPRIDGVVMLFPPNRGAALADRWQHTLPYRWLLGPAGQEVTTAAAAAVPPPCDPFVIIAGGRGDGRGRNRHLAGDDDGTVRVAETRLPGARAHHVIDVGHTFGMRDARVLDAVRRALAQF